MRTTVYRLKSVHCVHAPESTSWAQLLEWTPSTTISSTGSVTASGIRTMGIWKGPPGTSVCSDTRLALFQTEDSKKKFCSSLNALSSRLSRLVWKKPLLERSMRTHTASWGKYWKRWVLKSTPDFPSNLVKLRNPCLRRLRLWRQGLNTRRKRWLRSSQSTPPSR